MDDRQFFEVDEDLTPLDQEFLAALRTRLPDGVRPYFTGCNEDGMCLVVDIDAPDVALVSVGLALRDGQLKGDRISVHDRSFPPRPTVHGFAVKGPVGEMADRAAALLEWFWLRPVVLHEWVHRSRVYAVCYMFEDTAERLAQMYRGDWAPIGQEARLIAEGHVHGGGWVQTEGLGAPDRVTLVRGQRGTT